MGLMDGAKVTVSTCMNVRKRDSVLVLCDDRTSRIGETIYRAALELTPNVILMRVEPESLNEEEVTVSHISLNDRTVEGLVHKGLPVFSVQYHPEASPGPHDSKYLFRRFVEMMETGLPPKGYESVDANETSPRGDRP